MVTVIESFPHLHKVLTTMSEEDLRESINYEVSTYCRPNVIKRMFARYGKLRQARQYELLIKKEILL